MNIPTVEELLVQEDIFRKLGVKEPFNINLSRDTHVLTQVSIKRAMIKFAKLHCIEQAKVISEKAKTEKIGKSGSFYDAGVDKDSILKAYDLKLIK